MSALRRLLLLDNAQLLAVEARRFAALAVAVQFQQLEERKPSTLAFDPESNSDSSHWSPKNVPFS